MATVLAVAFGVTTLILAGVMVLAWWATRGDAKKYYEKCEAINSAFFDIRQAHQKDIIRIEDLVRKVIEGERLRIVLQLSPASLRVASESFEPKKDALKSLILQTLDCEVSERAELNMGFNPGALASAVLSHSGWEAFVNSDTRKRGATALTRLLANGNEPATRAFLEELVDKL